MKKSLIIFAILLIIAGAAVFFIAFHSVGYDASKLSTAKAETNTYTVEEAFTKVVVDTKTADVVFKPAEDGKFSVVCVELEKMKHTVTVTDGILRISLNDTREWMDYLNFYWKELSLTVYLPVGEYQSLAVTVSTGNVTVPSDFSFKTILIHASTGDVKCYASASEELRIRASTGNIKAENLHTGKLVLRASTGNITANNVICDGNVEVNIDTGNLRLIDVTCKDLSCKGDTGNIVLVNVVGSGDFYIKTDTGDIGLDSCDAANLVLKSSTGNVTGTLRTPKTFEADSHTGRENVPNTTGEGTCEVKTSTGDIRITIVPVA